MEEDERSEPGFESSNEQTYHLFFFGGRISQQEHQRRIGKANSGNDDQHPWKANR